MGSGLIWFLFLLHFSNITESEAFTDHVEFLCADCLVFGVIRKIEKDLLHFKS